MYISETAGEDKRDGKLYVARGALRYIFRYKNGLCINHNGSIANTADDNLKYNSRRIQSTSLPSIGSFYFRVLMKLFTVLKLFLNVHTVYGQKR